MITWQQAYDNIEMHVMRERDSEILRSRYHPSLGHYFNVAAEIRAIRLRDAEQALVRMGN